MILPVVTVKLEPVIAAPVIAPVAEINPAVRRLPPCTFAVALSVVPEITFAPEILPPDPEVIILPPVMLPVALTTPPVLILPPVMLPDTDTVVPVCVVALTLAPPKTLPPVMLPDNDNAPVEALNVNFVVVTLAT